MPAPARTRTTAAARQLTVARVEDSLALKRELLQDSAYLETVSAAGCALAEALAAGHKALFFGNGGSAADAQHLAAELSGRFLRERRSLPGLALSVNPSALTAIGNDYGYEMVFARQLAGLGAAGDVAVGISTSGNSPNILRALEVAREHRLVTIGLTGRGGKLAPLVDYCIHIPSDCTPRIQEAHILTGHILCEITEQQLFNHEAAAGRTD